MPIHEKNYPEWLESLRGESPLLSTSEWEFIAEIRSRIIREVKTKPDFPYDKNFKYKLSIMKDNFKQVVKYLKNSSQSLQYFLEVYPKWRIVRDINILQLMEIANSVNSDSHMCLFPRIIGSSLSLIGGVICLANESGANPASRILESAVMGLGTMTSAGTSLTELALLREKVKKAEQIIKDDKEYSEKLWAWISDTSYVQEAVDSIRYIDVDMNLLEAANKFQDLLKKKRKRTMLEQCIKVVLESLKCSPKLIEELSDVIGILTAVSMLYDRYRLLFNLVSEGFKLALELRVVYDLVHAAVGMKSITITSKCAKLTDSQKRDVAAGMFLDAINIFLSAKDLKSKSKHAERIAMAADKLKEEAKVFKKLYDEINNL